MDSQAHAISYLSPSVPVNMGDWWFDVANGHHFWIQRRFHVMSKLADSAIRNSKYVAEIGCGNGLLQREIEDHYKKPVTGFDLNECALQKNVSCTSPLYYYDILQRNPEFRAKFDLMFLFDVLEHIEDESEFLQSVKFHLASSGILLVNVPAHQRLYSDYDRAAGHVRRYGREGLIETVTAGGLEVERCVAWGFPFSALYHRHLYERRLERSGPASPGRRQRLGLAALGALLQIDRVFVGVESGSLGYLLLARSP